MRVNSMDSRQRRQRPKGLLFVILALSLVLFISNVSGDPSPGENDPPPAKGRSRLKAAMIGGLLLASGTQPAAAINLQFPPAQAQEMVVGPGGDASAIAGTWEKNKNTLVEAQGKANVMIENMATALDLDGKKGLTDEQIKADPRFQKAFGNSARTDVGEVKKTVAALRDNDRILKVSPQGLMEKTNEGQRANGGYYSKNGDNIGFGDMMYRDKQYNADDRAGMLIHEAAHGLSEKNTNSQEKILPPKVVDIMYADLKYSNLKKDGLGEFYEAARDKPRSKMHNNADSYRVFAGACSDLLRRRALDDGVTLYRRGAKNCAQRVNNMNAEFKKAFANKEDPKSQGTFKVSIPSH
ncbi:hypothetical protein BC829DRAFT_260040 [Chytridium lagenaria]|nr:hypothetical protein BC829DRAFT_260040 [Chytridium lagenaria]